MAFRIKDYVRHTSFYTYHLAHPENEFLTTLLNREVSGTVGFPPGYSSGRVDRHVSMLLFKKILEDNVMLVYDFVDHIDTDDKQSLGRAAIDVYNRDILELLCKHGLPFDFYNPVGNTEILQIAYQTHGSEIIKFMSDIGLSFSAYHTRKFFGKIIKEDTNLLCYIVQNKYFNNDLVLSLLNHHPDNFKELIELFFDQINPVYHKRIYKILANKPVDFTIFFLNYTVSINSNKPLKYACEEYNLDLIEFYLQYGLQVDSVILKETITGDVRRLNGALKLFLKYNVNFSLLQSDKSYIDDEVLNDLEDNGLSRTALMNILCYSIEQGY